MYIYSIKEYNCFFFCFILQYKYDDDTYYYYYYMLLHCIKEFL